MEASSSCNKTTCVMIMWYSKGENRDSGKFLKLNVNKDSTIGDVKILIEKKWKIKPQNQILRTKEDEEIQDKSHVNETEYLLFEDSDSDGSDANNTSDDAKEENLSSCSSFRKQKVEDDEESAETEETTTSNVALSNTSSDTVDSISSSINYEMLVNTASVSDAGVEDLSNIN